MGWGGLAPVEELGGMTRLFCTSLEEEPGPCPWLHYYFLTVYPSFLCSLTSLISDCICHLESKESLGGWSFCPSNKRQGTQKTLGPSRPPVGFHHHNLVLPIFYWCVTLYCMDILFSSWWAFILFLFFSYYECLLGFLIFFFFLVDMARIRVACSWGRQNLAIALAAKCFSKEVALIFPSTSNVWEP